MLLVPFMYLLLSIFEVAKVWWPNYGLGHPTILLLSIRRLGCFVTATRSLFALRSRDIKGEALG